MLNSDFKKTIFFALISLSCYIAVDVWYQKASVVHQITRENKVGYLEIVDQDVLVKEAKRNIWLQRNKGESLYSGEVVKTEQNSSCQINLDHGDKIKLNEKSMIVLNKSLGNIDLELVSGKLFIDQKKGKISLKANGEKIDLTQAKVSLNKEQESLKIQVLEGEVDFQGKKVKEGEELIKTEDLIEVKKSKIITTSPINDKIFYVGDKDISINFNWNEENTKNIGIIIYKSGKQLVSQKTRNNFNYSFSEGEYSWKVISDDYSTDLSYFKVKKIKAKEIAFPEKEQIFYLKENVENIDFIVKGISQEVKDLIQVYYKDNLSNVKEYKVKNNGAKIPLEVNKTVFLRVKTVKEGIEVYSQPMRIFTKEKPKSFTIKEIFPQEEKIVYEKNSKVKFTWISDQNFSQVDYWQINFNQEKINVSKSEVEITLANLRTPQSFKITAYSKEGFILTTAEKVYEMEQLPEKEDINFSKMKYKTDLFGNLEIDLSKDYQLKECLYKLTNKKQMIKTQNCLEGIRFKGLRPGTYSVYVEGLDKFDRKVRSRRPASVFVPNKSKVKAPKLNKMRVKQ